MNRVCDLVTGSTLHLKTKGNVLRDAHVREKRVVLKDSIDWALEGGQGADFRSLKQNRTLGGVFEAGDQPKQGSLAATGRAEQRKEFVLCDGYRDIVKCNDLLLGARTENLGNISHVNRDCDAHFLLQSRLATTRAIVIFFCDSYS